MEKIISEEQVKIISSQINVSEIKNYICENIDSYIDFRLENYQNNKESFSVRKSFFGVLSIVGGAN